MFKPNQLWQRNQYYIDAAYNSRTRVAVIAVRTLDDYISYSNVVKNVSNVNEAEMAALIACCDILKNIANVELSAVVVSTDSQFVIDAHADRNLGFQLTKISRDDNIANLLVRAHKELL